MPSTPGGATASDGRGSLATRKPPLPTHGAAVPGALSWVETCWTVMDKCQQVKPLVFV